MSTQTIAVIDEVDLKDGPMKSPLVLLSCLGDKVHATSASCTWCPTPHGTGTAFVYNKPFFGLHYSIAYFNVCTGDIEDAPAPAAIHFFKTHNTGGKIYVTADPANTTKERLSRLPMPLASGSEVR
ncbi:hypothetical protein BGW80DRAFT_1414269 [Lactifluus volemus]|nr:hypothetical protein BGW80DRAFT_1414269 [Lactifluus volemus]